MTSIQDKRQIPTHKKRKAVVLYQNENCSFRIMKARFSYHAQMQLKIRKKPILIVWVIIFKMYLEGLF